MKIGVIGTGYVGLVAGVCFADTGHRVVCVDTDPHKVAGLRRGEVPIYEPGLKDLLARVQREGRIAFTSVHAEAVRGAAVVFLAVGTPEGPNGEPDLRYLEAALSDVLAALDGPIALVLKSTVPVGTAARLRTMVKGSKHRVDIVSNPEFLKEGAALDDFLRPDRVVIGTDSDEAFALMQTLYRPFTLGGQPVLRMSNVAAEVTKYAANAMLATRISFMNEVARLCDAVGADVKQVRDGIASDPRIGKSFLYPGCGYGGSCFPKDTQGLIHVARRAGVEMRVVRAAEQVNDEQKLLLGARVRARYGDDLSRRRIAIWGLAFKPQTDDVREAPSLSLAQDLLAHGAQVVGSDPEAIETFRAALADDRMQYASDPYEAARGADAIVLCTEWNEYRAVEFERLREVVASPWILDGRNVLDEVRAKAAGFEVLGIGRGRSA